MRLGWMADYGPPPNFLDVFRSNSPDNYARYESAEHDTLVRAVWIGVLESARPNLCMAAERLLCEDDAVVASLHYYRC